MDKLNRVSINYFSEFMCEAIKAFLLADELMEEANTLTSEQDVEKFDCFSSAGYHARYSFLTAANALEAAANALILGMNVSQSLYDDIEKLGTILKYEFFCILNKQHLDRDNILYAKIKDVVRCRNEFVHPKPRIVEFQINAKHEIDFSVSRTKTSNYPLYISMFEPKHVKVALTDILSFVAWVVFDVCGYDLKTGSFLIGNNVVSTSGEVHIAGEQYGFDLRPFGIEGNFR